MFRLVPPAGAPIKISQVLRAVSAACTTNGDSDSSVRAFGQYIQARHVFLLSSGRAALWSILKGLHHLRPERDVVAVPAYTCFSVAASIVRAGLRLYPVDIESETLDFDFTQLSLLPEEHLLCILSAHLFGLVNDISSVRLIAKAKGVFVVDDAAQALGASRDDRTAGTGGDVGFYSLGRGKALACAEGGIVVTDSDEIASALRTVTEVLPSPSMLHNAWLFLESLGYSIFLNPRLYWLPDSIPFLKLGTTEYDPDFRISKLSKLSVNLWPVLMEGLAEMNETRRHNAAMMVQALERNPHFTVPRLVDGSRPIYVRLPIIACDAATRDHAVRQLRAAGIGASPFYPTAVCDIEGISSHMAVVDFHRPRAEEVSQRLLTVPTHPYVAERDLQTIIDTLETLGPV
jgi:perosamine synthetase